MEPLHNEGTITINLGSSSGRSQGQEFFDNLNYKITLTGNGQVINREANSGETVSVVVAAVQWHVKVDSYFDEIRYSTGSAYVNVRVRQNNFVLITMFQVEEDCIWGDWILTKAPTCNEEGVETRTCQQCDETQTRFTDIDLNAHNWVQISGTSATCTTEGSGTRECAVCEKTETGDLPIDHDAHSWGPWIEITAPTCTAPGEETRTCAYNSDHTETRPIDHVGHDWGEWIETTAPTCTEAGEETRTCAYNEEHTETRPVDPDGHKWVQISGTPATCTTEGSGTRRCTVCEITETNDELPIDQNAHDWRAWIETTAPTCTAPGEETRTCAHNSDHTQTRPGAPALNHLFIENWEIEGDSAERICDRAGCDEKEKHAVFTVSFITNGGNEIPDQYIVSGYTASRPADPVRDGFTFNGWSFNFNTPVTANVTVQALWTENPAFIITYAEITNLLQEINTGIIIRHTGTPSTATINTAGANPEWYINGILIGTNSSLMLNVTNPDYNGIGIHSLTLKVDVNGIPYSRTVTFEVAQ